MKMTEDQVVEYLMEHLKKDKWNINSHCLGQTHGCDIIASKGNKTLIVEAKGARAGDNSKTKKREFFDSGQIKTHFGKAIVKILDEKHLNPTANLAIAHPDDIDIRKHIGHLIPHLKAMGVTHYWVSPDKTIEE